MPNPREFLIIFSIVGLVLPITAFHFVQPLSGDLTRIGLLPERAFGWNIEQPTIVPRIATVGNVGEAEILIAGDSFSISGAWQAYAFSPEQKYMTMRLGRICRDLPEFIGALGKPPKTLIIEAIERSAYDTLVADCANTSLQTLNGNRNGELSERPQQDLLGGVFASGVAGEPELNGDRKRSIFGGVFGYKYMVGSALYYLSPGDQERPGSYGGVRVRSVDDGCAFFSHRECGYGLFLGDDFTSRPLSTEDAASAKLAIVNTVFERVIVVVVPDKSSVYLESREQAERKDQTLRLFGQKSRVEVVPLQVGFYDAKSRIKDLYLPDDTHLSTAGYRELAAQIAAHARGNALGVDLHANKRPVASRDVWPVSFVN
jgi:hypothetical protein